VHHVGEGIDDLDGPVLPHWHVGRCLDHYGSLPAPDNTGEPERVAGELRRFFGPENSA
jgi:hypothetical protein